MSLQIPIRLKIAQNGTVQGYVETIDFAGLTATVNGPVATITGSGGGGGDADTLQGHPASFFATEADLTTLQADVVLAQDDIAALIAALAPFLDKTTMWSFEGVAVQASAPASGITYAQWQAGTPGNWAWIRIP